MPGFENLWEATSALDPSLSNENVLQVLSEHIPESFTLTELRDEVKKQPLKTPLIVLLGLLACLRAKIEAQDGNHDSDVVAELASSVNHLIAPRNDLDNGDEDVNDVYSRVVKRCSAVATAGVETLKLLANLSNHGLPEDALLVLIAYTDIRDGWTNPAISKTAHEILAGQLPNESARNRFTTQDILQDCLRPLFSKSRPSTVTASGRKAEFRNASDTERGLPDESRKTKPWKYTELGSMAIASWAVEEANEDVISKNWPLFIPVLLTLVDDSTTRIRARGLAILARFIDKFSAKLVSDTGLFMVFEDAILPTLMYLPNITPEDESLQLLPPAYDALICLGRKLGPELYLPPKKQKFLDKVMREGILVGYSHASTHVRIVEVLMQMMPAILHEMGIHTMRHLKDVIPMLAATITNPFAMSSPGALASAIKALQVTIAQAHPGISVGPRAEAWQNEIIRILVVCWLNASEDTAADLSPAIARTVKQELGKTAQVLSAIMSSGTSSGTSSALADRVAPLVSKDPRLGELFGGST